MNCPSNNSDTGDHLEFKQKLNLGLGMKVFVVCAHVILTIGTILGNVLVVRAFCTFSTLRRTASNIILVSLSVADTLMGVVFMLRITNILCPKLPPHLICSVTSMLSLTFNSVIILHLALISVDRFIAVKFAMRYLSIVTNRRVLIASIAVWLWGIAVSLSGFLSFLSG